VRSLHPASPAASGTFTERAAELEGPGVGLVVLDQAIDTTTPSGRLLFHTLAAVAEFERDLIRERVSGRRAAAKRRGARIGRPRALRGPVTFQLERRLAAGASLSAVARELGVAVSTVSREAARLGLR
jgi:DNA invertase Pin-like site-specific DNA recombinase